MTARGPDGPSDGYWEEDRFRAMGTRAQVIVGGAPTGALAWARAEIERLEACWSRFWPWSELSRVNRDPRPEVTVSPRLADVLAAALDAWRRTGGRFDPTVLDALEAAGYDRSFEQLGGGTDATATPPRRSPTRPAPGLSTVELDLAAGILRRPPGLRLDLGGIGKGLALDRLATGLRDRGARHVSLSIGGDVRVEGAAPPAGWVVPVEDPFDQDRVWFEEVFDGPGAIVTSSTRYRRWTTEDGAVAHHLIDPRTGEPAAGGITAVVVRAGEAWWAEVVAKAALVAGPEAPAVLAEHGVAAWLAHDDGTSVSIGIAGVAPGVTTR